MEAMKTYSNENRCFIGALVSLMVFAFLSPALGAECSIPPYSTMERQTLQEVVKCCEREIRNNVPEFGKLKALGVAWHNLAVCGVEGAPNNAVDVLETARKENSEDMIVLSYLGSSYTMKGRDSLCAFNMVRYVNKGLKYLDRAVEKDRNNFILHLIRGLNNFDLPPMYKRRDDSYEDFLILSEMYKENPDPNFSRIMTDVYRKLSIILKEKGEFKKACHFSKLADQSKQESTRD
jgi:tetratricopeptide (TPR) repeat protein